MSLHGDGVDRCYRWMGTGHTRSTAVATVSAIAMVSAIEMLNGLRVEATIHATSINPYAVV